MASSVVLPISSVMALIRDLSQWVRAHKGMAHAAPAAASNSRLVMVSNLPGPSPVFAAVPAGGSTAQISW